ncbi:MAG: hypothetical protein AAGI71_15520 [Bacteroidota bacterium]
MARSFPYVLLAVSAFLLVWGLLGLVEYFAPSVALGLQDPGFPPGTQFLHWLLLVLTGTIFVVGFLLRWTHTPFATITMYATLATLCFVETVDFGAFGGGPERFFIMGAEYVTYVVLSVYLVRSRHIAERFETPRQPAMP